MESCNKVMAGTSIFACDLGAIIDVILAIETLIALQTVATMTSDVIVATCTVVARKREAFIDVGLAIATIEANGALAFMGITNIAAYTAVRTQMRQRNT